MSSSLNRDLYLVAYGVQHPPTMHNFSGKTDNFFVLLGAELDSLSVFPGLGSCGELF